MLDTRRNPHMGFEPQQPCSNLELVNEFAEHMALGIEKANAALTKAKDEYTVMLHINLISELLIMHQSSLRYAVCHRLVHK
jgi:hypothetical protein